MVGALGGLFLGWGLGANDTANVFGTAVGSRMLSFRTATVLTAVCVTAGAVLQGTAGIETLQGLSEQTARSATFGVLAAAVTVALFTRLRIPTSTSQAVVGAMMGIAVVEGQAVDTGRLIKIVACWLGTPVGAMGCYIALYWVFRPIVRWVRPSVFALDPLLRAGLVLCGCYGAYALGANNVANVASVLVVSTSLSPPAAALVGGASIAIGALTYSRPVMETVGRGLVQLDAFSATIAILSQAVTVHVFAVIGVPVSTSQAVVGAVMGIGVVKGLQVVRWPMLSQVLAGWLMTPAAAGLLASLAVFAARFRYVP